jgi:glycosyltransferase involved in cell wall biosynthesis
LFVGRVIRTKGVIDGIRALAHASTHCEATLDVIGVGDMLEQCKLEARRLGVEKLVTFHGRIDREEVFNWYKKSDVFLFPSFREPSGTVVFEAMGFGLPMITTTLGGPGYVITDECGVRITPDDPKQFAKGLAEAIVELSKDRNKLQGMSEAAIRRVDEVASWEERAEKLISIYEAVFRI